MIEFLKALMECLTPPRPGADGNRIWRWRVVLVVITMTNATVTGGFIALAFGMLPLVSFQGFAPAGAITQLESKNAAAKTSQDLVVADIKQGILDGKIMDTRIRQCAAIKQRDKGEAGASQVIEFATERLQEQLVDYQALTQRRYRLPDCSEV